VGALVRGFKSAVTKQIGFSPWQRNYFEHIIRDWQSYQTILEYIINNPQKWENDKFYCIEN
jgi:REP element-mobilizing transposase RayT